MPKISKQKTTVIIVFVCFGLIFGIKMFNQNFRPNNQSSDLAKAKGLKNAPIKIIEYVDFQCPSCAKGAHYLKNFMTTNPGKVRLELKYYPLAMHQHSFMASLYAECVARQGKFWEFQDLIFERQDQWKNLINPTMAFHTMFQEIRVNMIQLNTCLRDKAVEQLIEQNKTEGSQLGVKSTPSYFVNGRMIVGYKSLEEELNRLIMVGGNPAMGQAAANVMSNEFQSRDPRLKASYVCMKDNKYLGTEQVPIEINGKTYYACCQNDTAQLRSNDTARYAADPLTGEDVDKADAYIVLKPDGSEGVLYFKSAETYLKYIEKNEVKSN